MPPLGAATGRARHPGCAGPTGACDPPDLGVSRVHTIARDAAGVAAISIGGAVVVALAAALADRGPDVLVTSELPSTMVRTEER